MVVRARYLSELTLILMLAAAWGAAGAPGFAQAPGPRQPARDTPAQSQDVSAQATGLIAGRVLAADTGRAVKRARVSVSATELPGGRGILTEDDGTFQIADLPA